MLSSNQVLNQGRYRIIDQFGSVEAGRLYEAYDTVSNSKVVLRETVGQLGKVATAAQIENLKATFAQDAERLKEVEHPSLLKVQDYFSEIDHQYLVMESCEGNDLASLFAVDEKAPSISDILKWGDQLLDGLHYLHLQTPQIVHRSVSPRNARLSSNFKVKLLVTGEQRENEAIDSEADADDDTDLAYKSLEQLWLGLDSASRKMIANSFGEKSEEILRQPLDARTDVYSAGATLYFLLTKTEPPDSLARYLEILDGNDDPLRKPDELNSSIPAELSELLIRSLELKREERLSSAAEMRVELAKVKVARGLVDTISNTAPAEPSPQDKALEEEQLRVEQQRMELEAEHKRLEDEQARIEKRKLELDAERKRQTELLEAKKVEEARLHAEKVQAEQKAAAERLKAQKAAAEKAAAEKALAEKLELARKQTLAAEAKKKEAASQPEVEKLQMELAKENLLDLPEAAIEISVEPDIATDVLALDSEQFTPSNRYSGDTSFDLYSSSTTARSFITRPPVLAGLAAVVLAGIVGVYLFVGAGSSTTAKPSPAASIQTQPSSADQPVQTVESPSSDQSNSTFASQTDQQATVTSPGIETKVDQDAKKVHKQPTPQTKPAPEKKKNVTVDDLINDN